MKKLAKVVVVAVPALLVAGSAFAGADTTFTPIVTVMTDWLAGSLGTLMAVMSLAIGLGMGIARATATPAVIGIVVALFANFGPGVLTGIATGTI